MTSKKIPLSHETLEDEIAVLDKEEYVWIKIAIVGIITALGAVIVIYIIAIIFNFFNFGFMLVLFNSGLLLLFFSGVYFLISGLSIWFGPSPQWADVKSRVLKQTIKPKKTAVSLQSGFKNFVTGLVLMILAN